MEIIKLIRRAIYLFKTEGIKSFMLKLKDIFLNKFRKGAAGYRARQFLYDLISHYDPDDIFTPSALTPGDKLKISWVIPGFSAGAGGHMAIFRIIYYLEKFGHKNQIYIFDKTLPNAGIAKNIIRRNFIDINADVFMGVPKHENADVTIATLWRTAYAVHRVKNTKQKFYFIQDYEPYFYPRGSDYLFAEQTYKMGFKCICSSPWLDKIMREKYKNKSDYIWYSFDRDKYYLNKDVKRDPNKVIFYGRPHTPRRLFELAVLILKELKEKRPNLTIEIFGADVVDQKLPFAFKNRGILSDQQLSELYNSASIGIVFSATNCSLIPKEMMACKLPVVEIRSECVEEIFSDGVNITMVDPVPRTASQKIIDLLDDPGKGTKITENAWKWVNQFSWESSARKIENMFYGL